MLLDIIPPQSIVGWVGSASGDVGIYINNYYSIPITRRVVPYRPQFIIAFANIIIPVVIHSLIHSPTHPIASSVHSGANTEMQQHSLSLDKYNLLTVLLVIMLPKETRTEWRRERQTDQHLVIIQYPAVCTVTALNSPFAAHRVTSNPLLHYSP